MGNIIDDARILITGATGSFGKKACEILLKETKNTTLIVFSRDELKQFEMTQEPRFAKYANRLRFFIGNVRDKERLARAFDGVDYVIHAAALKQVPAAEYNPFEAIKTNVMGAQNVINCAIDKGVKKVVALSTDKAASPINIYGATKLCSDKLFISGNMYSAEDRARFSVVRYGNVIGSRGSVITVFLKARSRGVLPITDLRMTRFWLTIEHAVRFVIDCLLSLKGGELFVPKIPSMKLTDLAAAIAPQMPTEVIGIRPGEKLHEVMIPRDEARQAIELEDRYIVLPILELRQLNKWKQIGKPCPENFKYSSDNNAHWLDIKAIQQMISQLDLPEAREWVQEMGI